MKWMLLSFVAGGIVVGCYQIHSDDDLRTVPATNNPNVIQDSNRKATFPAKTH